LLRDRTSGSGGSDHGKREPAHFPDGAFVEGLGVRGNEARQLYTACIGIPEMKIITDDIDHCHRLQGAVRTQYAAEHFSVWQHDGAAVRYVGFNPAADHGKKLRIPFVVGPGKGGIAAGMAVNLDDR